MSSDDKKLAEEFGITEEIKTIYHFEGHRYDRLSDAINYARSQRNKPKATGDSLDES